MSKEGKRANDQMQAISHAVFVDLNRKRCKRAIWATLTRKENNLHTEYYVQYTKNGGTQNTGGSKNSPPISFLIWIYPAKKKE